MRHFGYLVSGLLLGFGLALSGMAHPMRLLNFLDVASPGLWDPSFGLALGAALLTSFFGYRWVWRRGAPIADSAFHLPPKRPIFDRDLVNGAVIFGLGLGLAGLWPGAALAALGFASADLLIFVAAMLIGMAGARFWKARPQAERVKRPDPSPSS